MQDNFVSFEAPEFACIKDRHSSLRFSLLLVSWKAILQHIVFALLLFINDSLNFEPPLTGGGGRQVKAMNPEDGKVTEVDFGPARHHWLIGREIGRASCRERV